MACCFFVVQLMTETDQVKDRTKKSDRLKVPCEHLSNTKTSSLSLCVRVHAVSKVLA